MKYLGNLEIGNRGDVKVIDKAARNILSTFNKKKSEHDLPKIQDVYFEIGEMGVKIVDNVHYEVMFKK